MKHLTKNECEKLLQQCIRLVKKKESNFFVLRKLRGVMGLCYWDWIELDPRKEFLPTAIHECLHFLYPDWSETYIRYAESRIMNQSSFLKLMEFISNLSLKLYKKEYNRKKSIRKKKNKRKKGLIN
jgi:hypothetical protein